MQSGLMPGEVCVCACVLICYSVSAQCNVYLVCVCVGLRPLLEFLDFFLKCGLGFNFETSDVIFFFFLLLELQ